MKYNLCFARFPYGASEHPDVTDWLISTAIKVKQDPRFDRVHNVRKDDTPITMSRNWVVEKCKHAGVDFLIMVDSDMRPDMYLGEDPEAKPFWDTTIDFMINHNGPCIVGAPYCGPPPHENVYVFQWARLQSDHPNYDMRLDQITREEAAKWRGIVDVDALPTGLVVIDMRCFAMLKPPYFDYEWSDPPYNTAKASTEDVFFTRNAGLAGVPNYCNFDAWAGHHKRKAVGKPVLITTEQIGENMRDALLKGRSMTDKLHIINDGDRGWTKSKASRLKEQFEASRAQSRVTADAVAAAKGQVEAARAAVQQKVEGVDHIQCQATEEDLRRAEEDRLWRKVVESHPATNGNEEPLHST